MSLRSWKLACGPLSAVLVYAALVWYQAELPEAGRATLAMMAWMAVWWLTEAVEIATTALLPLALFPLLGIRGMPETSAAYAHPLIFLFLGGFLIALAMQRCELDRRIALLTLRQVGTRPPNLVLGFMLATAGLSAFVSNTATAAMMLPIAASVIQLTQRPEQAPRATDLNLAVCLLLGIAYAASIGGLMTIIGTPPNVFMVGFLRSGIAEPYRVEISFVRWLWIGVPVGILLLPACWWLLTYCLFPVGREDLKGGRALIQDSLRQLGRLKPEESRVLAVFLLTATAWIVRPLLARWNWSSGTEPWYPLAALTDGGIAMTAALVLFLLPSSLPGQARILDWSAARRIPWEILLLFGGGISLADAVTDNGVAEFLGGQAHWFRGLPLWVSIVIVTALVVFLTELTSNLATTSTLLPLLAAVAPGMDVHPYALVIPAALAASCAFMLPVATPPNAIVFGTGQLKLNQMAWAGWWLNLISIVVVSAVALSTWRLL